jgi:DNA-binding LacI/PurR family transcriptional regulator
MADVAAAVGVSHQTVSRVLNDSSLVRPDTRERVLAAIAEMGYRRNNAARALASNHSRRIGMVAAHLGYYGPSTLATAVQAAGHESGYDVSLIAVEHLDAETLRDAIERLLGEAVEAVVVAVAHTALLTEAHTIDAPVPVVLAQGVTSGQPLAVGIDQTAGGRTATDHLLDLGHTRVAHVTGPLGWAEADQRRVGWQEAHRARGVEPGPEVEGDWTPDSGYQAGLRLAADTSVTAVFVANDAMAVGVLKALVENGRRVPEDVSVVGYDDTPESAFLLPSLTTVRQSFDVLGRQVVDLTLRALAGEKAPTAPLMAPDLVVRASTAPPA